MKNLPEKTIEELVVQEEEKIARNDQGTKAAKKESLKFPIILLGALIYSVGLNCFLRPLHLYSGGFMGFAQLFEELLKRAGISFGGFNISGIFYYLLNVPGLVIAAKKMRKRFIIKTVFAVTSVTILLSLVPIPDTLVLEDRISNTIVAGLICGAGIGIILWMGACDGGMNIIGMLIIMMKGKGSVGQVSLITNIILYTIMLFLFDVPTVIYSLMYSVFNSIAADKIHTQNISTQVTVITKLEDTKPMEVEVMGRLNRGMTEINASGIFTGDPVKIFFIYVSKYETSRLKAIIRSYDPHAFIVENEGVHIDGNFLRKLT
ncbi:MAG: YitT family protein [Lachnospiraceae bacterium]|nr:YitT family protein [Lachnospiraceae bacterium]